MTLHIGFLLFPNLQQLDFTAPYEVFATMVPKAEVHLAWKDRHPVPSVTGLHFTPTRTFEDCPSLDVLCIPGGVGVNALLRDTAVLDFVRRQADGARLVTSVCTGALVLAAAGLLRGRQATTHWLAHDLLSAFGAIPTQGRVVRDGNAITAGGVTAGIDFGLTAVAELAGTAEAQRIQLYFEYAPAPPSDAGHPETAPAALVESVCRASAASRREREAIVAAIKEEAA